MKITLEFAHRLVLIVMPMVATSAIAPLPTQAATLSSSATSAIIDGFSHTPYSLNTFTKTDTETFTRSGIVQANADAVAGFVLEPRIAGSNFSITQAYGEGSNYFGTAQSQSSLIGRFQINSGEAFSFNFLANLQLKTSVDNPTFETAFANGGIQFKLLDRSSGSVLDSFGLFGEFNSLGKTFLGVEPNNSLSQVEFLNSYFSDATYSSGSAQFSGYYARTFDSPVDFDLEESKVSQAGVQAIPAPSELLGLGIFMALAVFHKRYRSKNKL